MPNDEVNDFLFSEGGNAARFDEMGDRVSGTIIERHMAQQTSMDTNEPLTWQDGRPRMQLIITLATDERGMGDDDDGSRRLYAKGGNYEVATGSGIAMKNAIADAVKAAGSRSLDPGGKLTVVFTGEGKKTNRGYNAPKLYKAKYEPPVAVVTEEDLFGREPEKEPF